MKKEKMLLKKIVIVILVNFFLVFNVIAEERNNLTEDYVAKINMLGKMGHGENSNAKVFYEKALTTVVGWPDTINLSDIKNWPGNLSIEKQNLLKEWVHFNRCALDELTLGAKMPYLWVEYRTNLMITTPPALDINQLRYLVYLVCSRAKLSAKENSFEDAFSDLFTCYRFGEHLEGPKTIVEQSIGFSIKSNAVQTTLQILKNKKIPIEVLTDYQQTLYTFVCEQKPIDFTFDKYSIYDLIQKMYTDDGQGGTHISEDFRNTVTNLPEDITKVINDILTEEGGSRCAELCPKKTLEATDKLFQYLEKIVRKTPKQLREQKEHPNEVISAIVNKNPILVSVAPAYMRISELNCRNQAETEALVVILAALRYGIEQKAYPDSLETLVSSGYLKRLPLDPYSDSFFTYKISNNNFILYSFGADFDDDGGTYSNWGEGEEGGDQVFWPFEEK